MTTEVTNHRVIGDEVSDKEDARDANAELILNKPPEPDTPTVTTAPTQQQKKNVKIDANPQEAEKKVSRAGDTTEGEILLEEEEAAGTADEEAVLVEKQAEESKEGKTEESKAGGEQVTSEPKMIDTKEDQPAVAVQDDNKDDTDLQQRPATTTHEVPLLRTSLRNLGASLKDVFIGHLPHVGIVHGASGNATITEEQVKIKFIPRHKWDKVMEYLNQQEEILLLQDELKQPSVEDVALKIETQNEAEEAAAVAVAKEEEEDDVVKKDVADEGEETERPEEKKKMEDTLLLTSTQSFTEDEDSILKTLDDTVEDLKHKQEGKEKQNEEVTASTADTNKKDVVSSTAAFQGKDNHKEKQLMIHHDDNILHLVCRHHPPVCIVSKILKLYHHYVSELNSQNECPLHVAASYGASPQIIKLLINSYPLAVSWQDIRGRTPLHGHLYECCSFDYYEHKNKYCCDPGHYMVVKNKEDNENTIDDLHNYKPLLVQGPLHEVIQYLCEHITSDDMGIKDKFNHIPLDIAKYYECENVTLAVIKEAM